MLQSGRSSHRSRSPPRVASCRTRSTALMHAPDADRIRHGSPCPRSRGRTPRAAVGGRRVLGRPHVGDVDVTDRSRSGRPSSHVWSPFARRRPPTSRGEPGAARLRERRIPVGHGGESPAGLGGSAAHVSVATAVLARTLTFHEAFRAADSLLLDQRSTSSGAGEEPRHGRGLHRGRRHGRRLHRGQRGRRVPPGGHGFAGGLRCRSKGFSLLDEGVAPPSSPRWRRPLRPLAPLLAAPGPRRTPPGGAAPWSPGSASGPLRTMRSAMATPASRT